MPRFEYTQRQKLQKQQNRQWELLPGSMVWCYLRHSPGDNQTIDSQITGMREWCSQNGWIIERMFIDEAQEGSKEERTYFQEMIHLSRQQPRPVHGIVVWSFSRFARSQLDSQYYKADLRKRGYVVLSKIDDVPNNEIAPIIESVIDWKNQRFLEDLSADVKRGLDYIVEQNCWPVSTFPIGYTGERVQIGSRRNGEPRMGVRVIKDESLKDRVALAWKMKLNENASYADIFAATQLFSEPSSYKNMFSNLLYAGIFVYHGTKYPLAWENGSRFCDPYVSLDEYSQVQENRKLRSFAVAAPRSLSSSYLLTGIIYCGECAAKGVSAKLYGQKDNRFAGTYQYYKCSTKIQRMPSACALPVISCWRVDEAVLTFLKEHIFTAEYVAAAVDRANELMNQATTDIHSQLDDALLVEKLLQKKVETIIELIGKKGMTRILETHYDAANKEWQEASARVAQLRSQKADTNKRFISRTEAQSLLRNMCDTLDKGSMAEQQKLVSRFIESVTMYQDRLEIAFKFNLQSLNLPGTADSPHILQVFDERALGRVVAG